MKNISRALSALLCLLLLLLPACARKQALQDPPEAIDPTAASLLRLQEDMDIDELHAKALLDLLSQIGLTGEVLFAYPAIDERDVSYYHVWIGDETTDIYMRSDGTAAAVLCDGQLVYGRLPDPPQTSNPNDPELPDAPDDTDQPNPTATSITVDDHTALVETGGEGYVYAHAEPGVEYRIKVYYASGISTAKALSPQVAGEDGSLAWEWTVNSRVKPGVYKIIIVRSDNEEDAVTLPFEVVEADQP